MSEKYGCPCGFTGFAEDFHAHTIADAYDYGNNDCAPAETELECPVCGCWEQDGIMELTVTCELCKELFPADYKDANGKLIQPVINGECEECRKSCQNCGTSDVPLAMLVANRLCADCFAEKSAEEYIKLIYVNIETRVRLAFPQRYKCRVCGFIAAKDGFTIKDITKNQDKTMSCCGHQDNVQAMPYMSDDEAKDLVNMNIHHVADKKYKGVTK